MNDISPDSLPPLRPREQFQRLATDTFCVHCGYNLQSQEVTRDERLGIFVCRCPECGRHHPAGVGVTASAVWVHRLASLLLFVWILVVLFALVWIVIGMGAVTVVHVEDFSARTMVDVPSGKTVEFVQPPAGAARARQWQPMIVGTTQPSTRWVQAFTRRPDRPDFWEFIGMAVGSAAVGFFTGLLLVVFLWHWPRRRYLWTLLLPCAVAAFVGTVFAVEGSYVFIRPWALRVAAGHMAWQMLFMLLGIRFGRPIVRGLLRLFVPPRPRQHLAFLWRCDGKTMPTPAPL